MGDGDGLSVTVCHLPPGTSKWNKIEHRLFAHISMVRNIYWSGMAARNDVMWNLWLAGSGFADPRHFMERKVALSLEGIGVIECGVWIAVPVAAAR